MRSTKRRIATVLDDVRPDTVVTFGPEGFTGHRDHRAVSRWTDLALARSSVRPLLLHAVAREEVVDRELDEDLSVFELGRPRVCADDELDVLLRFDGALRARLLILDGELVCALQGLGQYDLAEQWTEAMERWCESNAIGSIHGRCRVHRAEILRLRGSCHEAEHEALMACEELRPYLRRELGWPLNELGRIRLHMGDLAGAEDALLAAHRAGWDPQPGLALVRLAQGDTATAVASLRDAIASPATVPSKERPPNTDLQRAPLLEAQVQIEVAAGDTVRARSAAEELEHIAARFENKTLAASAASLGEGCGSPTATRLAPNGPSSRRWGYGTRSALRTRPRTHA